jgi:hypothetical protein
MRETVTAGARAAHAVRLQLGAQRLMIWDTLPNLRGSGVALTTIQVVVLLAQVDFAIRLGIGHLTIATEIK